MFGHILLFFTNFVSVVRVKIIREDCIKNATNKKCSLLHRACCRVTQLLNQPMHIYNIYKILHVKTLKKLLHVSVLRPSSGSYIFLAKVTLEIVTY